MPFQLPGNLSSLLSIATVHSPIHLFINIFLNYVLWSIYNLCISISFYHYSVNQTYRYEN